jgi:hypothetical protein
MPIRILRQILLVIVSREQSFLRKYRRFPGFGPRTVEFQTTIAGEISRLTDLLSVEAAFGKHAAHCYLPNWLPFQYVHERAQY